MALQFTVYSIHKLYGSKVIHCINETLYYVVCRNTLQVEDTLQSLLTEEGGRKSLNFISHIFGQSM